MLCNRFVTLFFIFHFYVYIIFNTYFEDGRKGKKKKRWNEVVFTYMFYYGIILIFHVSQVIKALGFALRLAGRSMCILIFLFLDYFCWLIVCRLSRYF